MRRPQAAHIPQPTTDTIMLIHQISRGSFFISQGGFKVGWVISAIDQANRTGVEVWILNTTKWEIPNSTLPDHERIVMPYQEPQEHCIPAPMTFTYIGGAPGVLDCTTAIAHLLAAPQSQILPQAGLVCSDHTITINPV